MKFEHLTTLVKNDIKHNNVPMLVGEPGIGKSSWVENFAAEVLSTRCFCLACNQLADKADLTGCRLVPVGKKANGEDDYAQVFYPHTIIRQAIDYALDHPNETPILFLDEINRSTPDVTSEALSIPTMRSIGDHHIPDNLKVIIAGNDKGNVCALDKASITRFVMYRIEPDASTFLQVNNNINPYVEAVLRKQPSYIYLDAITITGASSNDDDDDNEDGNEFEVEFDDQLVQMTTPRTITATSRWLNEYTYDELMQMMNTQVDAETNLLQEALIAHCGNTPFTMAVLEEIINASGVNHSAAAVATPTEPAKYKVCHNAKTRDELIDIVSRLSDEEKSALFVYALYDNTNNENLLSILAPAMTGGIKPVDSQMLMTLNANHALDRSNLDALMQLKCPIVDVMQMIGL